MPIKIRLFFIVILVSTLLMSALASADGNSIDKVYHPYVMPMETEVEWRAIYQDDNNADKQQTHRLGIGSSFFENLFTEIYLIGGKLADDEFKTEAIEIEAKLQLTEQGEYAMDWGVLFELEKERHDNVGEFATTLLLEKEWGRWVGAFNLSLEYEWGENIQNELDTKLASQLRYRYSRLFEPAIEFYQSEDTTGLGVVGMGDIRLGIAKKIHWELGVIFGMRDDTPDQTLRALLEYEF